jgi:hypothetical protein
MWLCEAEKYRTITRPVLFICVWNLVSRPEGRPYTEFEIWGSLGDKYEDVVSLVEIYRRFRGAHCLHYHDEADAVNISETSVSFYQITRGATFQKTAIFLVWGLRRITGPRTGNVRRWYIARSAIICTVHRSLVDPRKECESCGNARFRKRK